MNDNTRREKRGRTWNEAEKDILIEAIEDNKSKINSSKKDCEANKQKTFAWRKIAELVTAVEGNRRSAEECREKYKHLKCEAKKKAGALKKERIKTGGGNCEVTDLTEREDKLVSLIGVECVEGIIGGIDSSEVPLEYEKEKDSSEDEEEGVKEKKGNERNTLLLFNEVKKKEDHSFFLKKRAKPFQHTESRLLAIEEERLEIEKKRLKIEERRLEIEEKRLEFEERSWLRNY